MAFIHADFSQLEELQRELDNLEKLIDSREDEQLRGTSEKQGGLRWTWTLTGTLQVPMFITLLMSMIYRCLYLAKVLAKLFVKVTHCSLLQ